MKKITKKSPLWVVMGLVLVFAMSCANEKTFEGTWQKVTKVGGETFTLTFESGGKGSMTAVGSSKAMTWSADYTKKKITITVYNKEHEANYEFSANFKKLRLATVTGDVNYYLEGDYEKQ